jgi:catecholate siderophore receptor
VPFDRPTAAVPVTFRQSASDADNHSRTDVAAVYAQNQVALSPRWQAVAGLRYERFDLTFFNNRTGDELRRADRMISPRAGLVFKPVRHSRVRRYSVSFLPSSGDQFASLTVTTQSLNPEQFANYELGAKWDVRPISRSPPRSTGWIAPTPPRPTRATSPGWCRPGSQRTTGLRAGL